MSHSTTQLAPSVNTVCASSRQLGNYLFGFRGCRQRREGGQRGGAAQDDGNAVRGRTQTHARRDLSVEGNADAGGEPGRNRQEEQHDNY